jgi:CheY-like chemotaxis protein
MKKILIVDDQAEVRELVNVTLRVGDYQILQAGNGAEAVDIARAEKPDLIIMDVMMPGDIDGYEATRILKSDETTRGCSIVMLTAKGQKVDKDEGFDSGADDYFAKPFSPLELIRKVEKTLS